MERATRVGDERTRPFLSWVLLVAVLLVAAERTFTGDGRFGVLAATTAAIVLVPVVVRRSTRALVPWEVLVIPLLALGGRTIVPETFAGPMAALALASLALVIVVEVELFTPTRTTQGFGAILVVMTTMALASGWLVVGWLFDPIAGTTLVTSNDAVMWALVAATIAGVPMGAVFDRYIRSTGEAVGDGHREIDREARTLGTRIGISTTRQRQLTRAMQLCLLGVLLIGALAGEGEPVVSAAFALFVTFLPALLRREFDLPLDTGLTLWITIGVFLHALGTFGIYDLSLWWHNVTHAFSATLVGAVGYTAIRAIDEHTAEIYLPPQFTFAFVVLFVVAAGVAWEIGEFAFDVSTERLGYEEVAAAQHGLADTMSDLVFNTLGALVVATWGTVYLTDVAGALSDRLDGK